jgi:hypothetical protein
MASFSSRCRRCSISARRSSRRSSVLHAAPPGQWAGFPRKTRPALVLGVVAGKEIARRGALARQIVAPIRLVGRRDAGALAVRARSGRVGVAAGGLGGAATRGRVVFRLAAQAGQLRGDGLKPLVGVEFMGADADFGGALGERAVHPFAQRDAVAAGRVLGGFPHVEVNAFDAPGNRFAHRCVPLDPPESGTFRGQARPERDSNAAKRGGLRVNFRLAR